MTHLTTGPPVDHVTDTFLNLWPDNVEPLTAEYGSRLVQAEFGGEVFLFLFAWEREWRELRTASFLSVWTHLAYLQRWREANPDTRLNLIYVTNAFLSEDMREALAKNDIEGFEAVDDYSNLLRCLQERRPEVFGHPTDYDAFWNPLTPW